MYYVFRDMFNNSNLKSTTEIYRRGLNNNDRMIDVCINYTKFVKFL